MAAASALNREDSRGIYADEQLAAALAYFRAGRYDKADAVYRKVLKKDPANAGALHMTGLIALKRGRPDRAIQLLIKAAKSAADRPEILCDLGNAFKAAGRHKDAVRAHSMVITLLPKSPEAHSNLGSAYRAAGNAGKAVECCELAVKLRPNDPELLYNLGNGLIAAERFVEAEEILRRVVYEKPEHVGAHINLGVALKEAGRVDAAIERFQTAVSVAPESAEAHWNLALMHLAMGHYADGWREYEWRLMLPDFAVQPFDRPRWQGENLDGRTLLVHAEQGLGDTIQFARFLPRLSQLDGRVVFACPARLMPLIRTIPGIPELVPLGSRPAHDLDSSLLSLPRLFDDGRPMAPVDPIYLKPDPARAAEAEKWLPQTDRFRVGIAWQGSRDYRQDERRSVPLVCFEPLARLDGVELVNLQQGDGLDQLKEISWWDRIVEPPEGIDEDGAFVDTLAAMSRLDMVVTSDTSIAHIAGAAGVPVHVALCHLPDWRWGLRGEHTAWYPTMRLFRQQRPGDWTDVFARIAADVAGRMKEHRG